MLNFVKEIENSDNIKPKLKIKEDQKPDKLHLIKSENFVVHDDNNDLLDFVNDIGFPNDIKPKSEIKMKSEIKAKSDIKEETLHWKEKLN